MSRYYTLISHVAHKSRSSSLSGRRASVSSFTVTQNDKITVRENEKRYSLGDGPHLFPLLGGRIEREADKNLLKLEFITVKTAIFFSNLQNSSFLYIFFNGVIKSFKKSNVSFQTVVPLSLNTSLSTGALSFSYLTTDLLLCEAKQKYGTYWMMKSLFYKYQTDLPYVLGIQSLISLW